MKIETKYHGEIPIEEKKIVTFETGIPGFPEEKQFVLLPLTEDHVYMAMQSVQTPELAFVITNPFLFFNDYAFDLDDAFIEQLGIEGPEDVHVFTILTVHDPFNQTTANLQAPIVINGKNNKGKQLILNEYQYTTKHRLFPITPEPAEG